MSAELASAHAAQNGVSGEPNSADKNVEMWKIKKLIKSLEAARGYVFVNYCPIIITLFILNNRMWKLYCFQFAFMRNFAKHCNE